jgi:hypothetical protein
MQLISQYGYSAVALAICSESIGIPFPEETIPGGVAPPVGASGR